VFMEAFLHLTQVIFMRARFYFFVFHFD
jgi:hypothetical protein